LWVSPFGAPRVSSVTAPFNSFSIVVPIFRNNLWHQQQSNFAFPAFQVRKMESVDVQVSSPLSAGGWAISQAFRSALLEFVVSVGFSGLCLDVRCNCSYAELERSETHPTRLNIGDCHCLAFPFRVFRCGANGAET